MPCHVMDIPISQSKQAKQNNPSFDLPKHSHKLMTNIHHEINKSFHMMPKKEMFKWSNFSKQFKLFWTNICAHQETKHPFCFPATRYKQQKMKNLREFKNTTNSLFSLDVCKLSAAMSHIRWAKLLMAVKNETNGTTEKILDWRGGDWPFHHVWKGVAADLWRGKTKEQVFLILGPKGLQHSLYLYPSLGIKGQSVLSLLLPAAPWGMQQIPFSLSYVT